MGLSHMQVGEVAERTGSSLRTVRHDGEVGIVTPSSRSQGGSRSYAEPDVARLTPNRRTKPVDVSLEEMRDLLRTAEDVAASLRSEIRQQRRSADPAR